jgi:hypothetical protein
LILRLYYVFHRGHEPWENFAERSPIISELIDSINTSVSGAIPVPTRSERRASHGYFQVAEGPEVS